MIAAADRALAAFFAAMDGETSPQRAERALTLHMLAHLAPGYFAQRQLQPRLDASLDALLKVPAHFGPKIGADEAMARLDALYLRKIRGLSVRPFDPVQVARACARAGDEEGPLWAWLMGALAAEIGVSARAEPGPLIDDTLRRYHLTHVVLLETRYLAAPARDVGLGAEVADVARREQWDLLGECLMCLARAGIAHAEGLAQLLAAQRNDGSFAETGSSPRAAAHCTAAGLLAVAGALDLQRPAP